MNLINYKKCCSSGMEIDNISKAIKDFQFGKNFIFMESVASSNSALKELLQTNTDLPLLLLADEQTGGRGRMQRNWFSPKGKGIWLSVAYPLLEGHTNFGYYNFYISLVISSAVETVTGIIPEFKWPNDILINSKKICGILSENITKPKGKYQVITGSGLNVNIEKDNFPDELRNSATSLMIESGNSVDRELLFLEIITNLNSLYDHWQSNGIDSIYYSWIKQCSSIGKTVEINTEKQYISGTARCIYKDGSLLLEEKSGKAHRIYAGDLQYIID